MQCGITQTGRIDPVVSPGKISSHVHKIAGSSNIGFSSTYASVRNSSCTSCEISVDKSNYWTPQLYYEHSNGSFEEVPNDGMVVYYLGRGDNRTNIQPFPPGFQMLSGDAGARAYDNTTMTFGGTQGVTYVNGTIGNATLTKGTWINGTKATGPQYFGRPVSDRVSFNCLADSAEPETPNMINTNCSNGLRAQIQFQSCWDGINLYKSDNSHVAYMSQIDNGVCPPGYPVQLVHLFYEVLYGTNNIHLDGGRFVFAQGDTTGYGFHGDFLNGWDETVLSSALSNCANTDNDGQISACSQLSPYDSSEYSWNCPQQASLINEPVRGMISKLPGCITITSGPQEATSADMSCPANVTIPTINTTPTHSGPYTTFLPAVGTVYNKWKYMGCANETVTGRSLTGASYANITNMTNEICQASCASKGFPLAATEYGSECYCGLTLDPTTSLGQSCSPMICSGNSSEFCGGPNILSVWNSTTYSGPYVAFPTAVGASLSSSKYMGCLSDNTSSRVLPLASFTNSTGMTLNSCMNFCASRNYALWGTEYSSECYCGSDLPSSPSFSASSTCNLPCTGNSTQLCGGASALTLFNNTAITPPPPAISAGTVVGTSIYLGCASEATSGRALNATSYSNATVTNAQCASFCASKNYALFGTEYSSECYCSNALAAGATLQQTGCSMACSGALPPGSPFANYANTCGGPSQISLWNNTLYKPVQIPATVGAYVNQGCYAEGNSGRALSNASWSSSSMTIENCVNYCKGQGVLGKWAGVEYGQQCYCGSGVSNGGGPASDGNVGCNMACAGNQYEWCGGPNRLNVYKST
ncbi:hypothetical protein MMC27_003447 [Xylographa pallens]|nr:hypothetical protein [Xylographa pallens]